MVWLKLRQAAFFIGTCICVPITVGDKFVYISPVGGSSMRPTMNPETDGDVLLMTRMSFMSLRKLQRGDVVSLTSPKNQNEKFTKRVIGLPGDIVKAAVSNSTDDTSRYVIVPPGHVWIEGDNVSESYDSNAFGTVPIGLIDAKVCFIIYPRARVSKIETKIPEKRQLLPISLVAKQESSSSSSTSSTTKETCDCIRDLIKSYRYNYRKHKLVFDDLDEAISSNSCITDDKTNTNYYIDWIS